MNRPIFFTSLHTNDLHARLDQMTRLATLIQRERAQARAAGRLVLLLDAGDSSSAKVWESDVTAGRANYAMLEAMGYDAAVIGNSDLHWGQDPLERLVNAAHFPALAANLRGAESGAIPTGLRGYALFNFPTDQRPAQSGERPSPPLQSAPDAGRERQPPKQSGVGVAERGSVMTVAVVGLTTHANTPPGFHFLDPAEALHALIPQLQNEGAHIIIVLSHLGIEADRKLAADAPEIHLILGGHTHTALPQPEIVGGTIIAQTGEFGSALGRVDLDYDFSSRTVTLKGSGLLPCPASTPPDPTLAGMLDLIRFEANIVRKKATGGG